MAPAVNEAVFVAGGALVIRPAPPPVAETVVRVTAFSLNRGDVRRALGGAAEGWRPGYDLAGEVVSGRLAGKRVVGLLPEGAWGRFVAVPAENLAVLPDDVGDEVAACLPVAGLTAYCALRHGGLLLGKRVLVTGASGGVGDFAVRMARLSGAFVVAQLRREADAAAARAAGADVVAVGSVAGHGPFDLVVDGVAGATLADALAELAPGGISATYGSASGERLDFDLRRFFRAGRTRMVGIALFEELKALEPAGAALARLVAMVASGTLWPRISVRASWRDVDAIGHRLIARDFTGKAVLRVE